MNEMKKSILTRLAQLEMKIFKLYNGYAATFPEDTAFWRQLALEEKKHASVLIKGRDVLLDRDLFPESFFAIAGNYLDKWRKMLNNALAEAASPGFERLRSYQLALEIEGSAVEIVYEKLLATASKDSATSVFREMSGECGHHADRILERLEELGYDVEFGVESAPLLDVIRRKPTEPKAVTFEVVKKDAPRRTAKKVVKRAMLSAGRVVGQKHIEHKSKFAKLRMEHHLAQRNLLKVWALFVLLMVCAAVLATMFFVNQRHSQQESSARRIESIGRWNAVIDRSQKAIDSRDGIDEAIAALGEFADDPDSGRRSMATRRIAELEAARKRGIAEVLAELQAEAERLVAEGDSRAAAELYANYRGRLAADTAEGRAAARKKILAAAAAATAAVEARPGGGPGEPAVEADAPLVPPEIQAARLAESRFEKLLEDLAGMLTSGRRGEGIHALESIAADQNMAVVAEKLASLRELLASLNEVDAYAERFLKKRVGQDEFMTVGGKRQPVRLDDVDGGRIRITHEEEGRTIRTSLAIARLDETEKSAWLGLMPPPARGVHLALLAADGGNKDLAADLLAPLDSPLKDALIKAAGLRDFGAAAAGRRTANEKINTELIEAVKNGSLAEVEALLRGGADANSADEVGRTPLLLAVDKGDLPMVELLLRGRAQPNLSDRFGRSPLHVAAANGELPIVELLLSRGAAVNAAIPGRGPTVKGFPHGATPLHLGARSGNLAVVELLISRGADPNARDAANNTPLRDAEIVGRLNVLDTLRRAMGVPPLVAALRRGDAKEVASLLAAGEQANAKDIDGATALHHAAARGDLEIASMLVKGMATVNALDGTEATPLHRAAANGHAEMVSMLLSAGAVVNVVDQLGRTPLHYAAAKGNVGSARLLLGAGASLAARDYGHETPLSLAEAANHAEMVELIKNHTK